MAAQYSRTNLIVNYLPQRLSDDEFRSLFSCVAPVKRAKVCRDKRSGYSFGFGFCEFYRPEDASKAIDTLNGHRLHHKVLKVAYARLQSSESKNCCLHLTNLPVWVTAEDIRRILEPYGGIISCKILADSLGSSRGIGFCLFETHSAASQAMEAMNQKPWPDTTEPPIHIRFAHPNEKKVRPPLHQYQHQQQQQEQQQHALHQPPSQQHLLQQQYLVPHHQQIQQLVHQQQQQQNHHQVMYCSEQQTQQQQQQQQQLFLQSQQLWSCCQSSPLFPYPSPTPPPACQHPLMRAALAYPVAHHGPPSLLLPPPPPPPLLPPPPQPQPTAYVEFRVCASNLSGCLDDMQLYGLFAPFGGIVEFSVARPDTAAVVAAAAPPPGGADEAAAAGAAATASAASSGCCSASAEDAGGLGSTDAVDGEAVEGGQQEKGEAAADGTSTDDVALLNQSVSATADDPAASSSAQEAQQQQQQQQNFYASSSVTVFVTFNNYQSAAGAVVSLNGQFVNGQQVQIAMRMQEPQPPQPPQPMPLPLPSMQPPMMPEGGDFGIGGFQ